MNRLKYILNIWLLVTLSLIECNKNNYFFNHYILFKTSTGLHSEGGMISAALGRSLDQWNPEF